MYSKYCDKPADAREVLRYRVDAGAFTMESQISGQGHHSYVRSDIGPLSLSGPWIHAVGGQLQDSPYGPWRHAWVQEYVHFRTEIPDFMGKDGKTLHLERHLVSNAEIKMTAHIMEGDAIVLGPCYAYLKKMSSGGPAPVSWLRTTGSPLDTKQARHEVLEQIFKMVGENLDEITSAQLADRVVPAVFNPGQVQGACRFYQSLIPEWMEPEPMEDTCPAVLRGGVEAQFKIINEPKGVCINVAPWNAPMTLSLLPTIGMLAAGNRVVIKPPDQTPALSAALRRLCQKYLHGYVWVEEGGKETVERLIDEGADHLVFTGGGEVAKHVAARCAMMLTPVTLELGGKSPLFIDDGLPESVLEDAVREVLELKVYKTGQFCCAHDYALVHEAVHDSFCAKLKAAIEGLGDKRHVMVLGRRQYDAVKAKLDASAAERMPPLEGPYKLDEANMTIPFTALVGEAADSSIMKEEIFGPLLPVLKVRGVDEAISIVNSVPTGKPLIAYCYSETPESVTAFSSMTSSGMLAINSGPFRILCNYNAPIGGIGPSGTGRSFWGREALREFSNRKVVCQAKSGFAKSYFSGPPPPPK